MSPRERSAPPPAAGERRFATTHWSVVLAAGGTDTREAAPALERLCALYWYPLYVFVRRKGWAPDDAADLTQEFLARLLEKNYLSSADPARGRFRTFLLTAFERFLINEKKRERRQKRGGGRAALSLDRADAAERYRLEPADEITPERLYERRWALTLLGKAMDRLGEECAATGRAAVFSAARSLLTGGEGQAPYAEIAGRLSMTEGAVKTAVHRLRRRYGEVLRAEIAETVERPEEIEDEIQSLFRALE